MFGQLQFRPSQTASPDFPRPCTSRKSRGFRLNAEEVAGTCLGNAEFRALVAGTDILTPTRCMTLDDYTGVGDQRTGIPPWQWNRSVYEPVPEPEPVPPASDKTLGDQNSPIRGDNWEQTTHSLWPTGSTVLFAMAGPIKINFGQ